MDISHRFLDDVQVDARPGEVLGLVGPNGAGKTTLVNVITGHFPPDEGAVTLGGVHADGRADRADRAPRRGAHLPAHAAAGGPFGDGQRARRPPPGRSRAAVPAVAGAPARGARAAGRDARAARAARPGRRAPTCRSPRSPTAAAGGSRSRARSRRSRSVLLLDEPTAGMTPDRGQGDRRADPRHEPRRPGRAADRAQCRARERGLRPHRGARLGAGDQASARPRRCGPTRRSARPTSEVSCCERRARGRGPQRALRPGRTCSTTSP